MVSNLCRRNGASMEATPVSTHHPLVLHQRLRWNYEVRPRISEEHQVLELVCIVPAIHAHVFPGTHIS